MLNKRVSHLNSQQPTTLCCRQSRFQATVIKLDKLLDKIFSASPENLRLAVSKYLEAIKQAPKAVVSFHKKNSEHKYLFSESGDKLFKPSFSKDLQRSF